MNQVKIKRLNDHAIMPTRGSAEAAGFDLYADIDNNTKSLVILPNQVCKIPTGFAI